MWGRIIYIGCVASLVLAPTAYARKTNQPLYEDPFDLAAGGASLTRATKEGRVFANPALLPQGGAFHRWLGFTFSLLANKESIGTARGIIESSRGQGSSSEAEGEESAEGESSSGGAQDLVDAALKNPVRVGYGAALSYINRFFGLSVFSRFEPDLRAREYGPTGLPEISFNAESYHGAGFGFMVPTALRWLSFGLTAKYVYAAEPSLAIEISDASAIQGLTDPDFVKDVSSHNKGVGFDAGMLVFLQGQTVDLSLAGKVDDVGTTQMVGDNPSPTELKQVISAGAGLALHTGTDAIHFAVDYRDIGNAYGEQQFKKLYAGTKVLLRTYVGLAAGFYNGYPSYGAELDLIFLRLTATSYTREMGENPGVDPRRMYMVSMSTGY